MAKTLTDTRLADVERALIEERDEGVQRTSVMTHIVWAPQAWLKAAERTLAGLSERHPSRTILLTPAPRRKDGIDALVDVRTFTVEGSERAIASEVVELTLKGRRATGSRVDRDAAPHHRSAGVLPLARRAGLGRPRSLHSSSA